MIVMAVSTNNVNLVLGKDHTSVPADKYAEYVQTNAPEELVGIEVSAYAEPSYVPAESFTKIGFSVLYLDAEVDPDDEYICEDEVIQLRPEPGTILPASLSNESGEYVLYKFAMDCDFDQTL